MAKTADWRICFEQIVLREQMNLDKAWQQCDKSDFMEGLYIKIESEDKTIGRVKWVRKDFVQVIIDARQHHTKQPFISN